MYYFIDTSWYSFKYTWCIRPFSGWQINTYLFSMAIGHGVIHTTVCFSSHDSYAIVLLIIICLRAAQLAKVIYQRMASNRMPIMNRLLEFLVPSNLPWINIFALIICNNIGGSTIRKWPLFCFAADIQMHSLDRICSCFDDWNFTDGCSTDSN